MFFILLMDIRVKKGDFRVENTDVLVVYTFQEKLAWTGMIALVDEASDGRLTNIKKEENFTGKSGQILWARPDGKIPAKRILVIGLGKQEDVTLETLRSAAAISLQAVKSSSAKTLLTLLDTSWIKDGSVREMAHAMTEGVLLADYSFGRYKKQKKHAVRLFEFLLKDAKDVTLAKKGIDAGRLFAHGTILARDLVNTPPAHMTPLDLVDAAKKIAKENKNIHIRIFDTEKLKRMGAGGILGVAQGSEHAPFMVHLTYTPTAKTKKSIALVGKGVTFDSGGISLKPADHMMTMKCDMGGAADVLGVFSVINTVAPKVVVHGIFAAVENMPSGTAIRPGDVIEIMNKKTVEVLNTDAEGRLILADALVYASRLKPDCMIDLATLTGACVVALGEEITGVMSNTPKLAQQILTASKEAGEKMWELPLEKNYRKLVSGDISDLKNIGGRWGGALTAGLFLEEFVDKLPWAHLDIAGPAFAERDIDAYTKKGGTGHGVRTLLRFLLSV